jgi:uncharacterized protein YndB with AHSA1/START domain
MNPSDIAADCVVQEIAINAPASRVFDAFTKPSERVRWWSAPDGRFVATRAESDLRPGGKWALHGTRQDGHPFVVRGDYRIVEPPTLLVFTWLPDWQGDATESLVRVEFTETSGVTHVRLTHSGLTTERLRTSHSGWPQLLTRLQVYAEGR